MMEKVQMVDELLEDPEVRDLLVERQGEKG